MFFLFCGLLAECIHGETSNDNHLNSPSPNYSASLVPPVRSVQYLTRDPQMVQVLTFLAKTFGWSRCPTASLVGSSCRQAEHHGLAFQVLLFFGKASISTVQGLDWHGPSARDVWDSLDALTTLLESAVYGLPWSWGIARNTLVLMMGHSNGGQGTWYLSSRYPDRILGGRKYRMVVPQLFFC